MAKKLIHLVICMLVLLTGSAISSEIQFHPNSEYMVGSSPYGICGADFDGDSDNDLAVANYMSASVSVLINNGDGTFETAINYDVGKWPRDLIAGEFTGDTTLDLAVLSSAPNGFVIMAGNGDGTFQDTVGYVPTGYDWPAGPYGICSGDFDNDSDNDIAIACDQTDNVAIYLNDENTEFAFHAKYPTGDHPWDIASEDLNGDNFDDLVVLNYFAKTISVLTAQGTGYFNTAVSYTSSGAGSMSICMADVVGDAEVDIIGGVGGDFGGYEVFEGNGDGTFDAGIFSGSLGYFYSTSVGDFNNDGHIDLAFEEGGEDSIGVLLNNGSGAFSAPTRYFWATDGLAVHHCAIDLNDDGYDDLAIPNAGHGSVTIMLNNGSGGFTTDVDEDNNVLLSNRFNLSNNYPNPFNPSTIIQYSLSTRSHVSITVFNILGQKIKTLVDGTRSVGEYKISWNGIDSKGRAVPSGIYFYQIKADNFIDTKKMLLMK